MTKHSPPARRLGLLFVRIESSPFDLNIRHNRTLSLAGPAEAIWIKADARNGASKMPG
ncbi:MAG: hypothetical protein Q7U26_11180 [Aquabacterium sp.]|nr:hypothetical protein [Aquabacterium sp.]